ncbi:LysR family transcriptional regulator [Endozoicomonas sp. OPT23]|uniref:LysR family transcriptional regulator n=1 Tax=Endozoicomonas sp. OPT23 TaxID=2072845 RepID=UPI00129A1A64|nr:LysR family transcriptional regulator [Endozoicomonas sp. OPT23]MRI35022.1 LysR family transcriptional regulator [Endozoicomonas sp. OPT23]
MDIPSLNAFLAVAETGSFSLAAERLHLTQPAVSKRIATLESQLDSQLFDRIGRQVSLSEPGRILLPKAREMLSLMKDTRQEINNLRTQVKGSLSMATSHHIGLRKLPTILKEYSRRYPQVRLDIHFVDSEAAYEMIHHGEIELGVITLSPEEREKFNAELIWEDPLVFMAANDHPLAGKKSITTKQLSKHQAILPGSNTFTYTLVKELFEQEGLELHTAMSSNYLETIRMLASIGLAWTILPKSMLGDDLVELDTLCRPPVRMLGHITHRERTLSNAAKAFLELLTEPQ